MAKKRAKKTETFHEALERIVSKLPTRPFKPHAYYNATGDIIDARWKDCDYYGQWINHQITLLKEQGTHEIIGVQVWALEGHGRREGKNLLISRVVRQESKKHAKEVRRLRAADRREEKRAKNEKSPDKRR